MKLASNNACVAIHRPGRPIAQFAQGKSTRFGRVLRFAMFAGTVLTAAPGLAQQTIVIGDDKPGSKSGDAILRETPGVVVNDDVLNSLGAPGTNAPALPPTSPYAASVGQEPQVTPGTAYRLPDTGQLVVSRPSTLLFPPQTFPQSRLTVPPPAGSTAGTTLAPEFSAGQSGTGQSRLLVPKPEEPVAPMVAQPTAPAVPRVPVTPAPTASAATAEIPPATEAGPMAEPAPMAAATPVEEPAPPPVATIVPAPEPMVPATPPAVAALPPEPAAEPPAPSSMVKVLQSTTPAESTPAPEPTPSEPASITPAPSAPAAQPAPAPVPAQSAALPPASAPVGEIRVVFENESAELTVTAKGLLEGVAKELMNNEDARVQLLAYAKGGDDGTSRARRLSLSRALAVRAFLIEKGVRSTRMDVRALGSGFKDGPADRVDILPQESTQ